MEVSGSKGKGEREREQGDVYNDDDDNTTRFVDDMRMGEYDVKHDGRDVIGAGYNGSR